MFNTLLYKSGSPAVTNPPSAAVNNMLSAAWLVGGALTVIGPAIYRSIKMNNYKNMYNRLTYVDCGIWYSKNSLKFNE